MARFSMICSEKFSKINYEAVKKSTNRMSNPNKTCMLYVSKVSCSSVARPSSTLLCTEHLQQKKQHSDSAKLTKEPVGTKNRCFRPLFIPGFLF